MSSFAEVYERTKFATNTRTQIELAEVLDIRQSSISDAKRRNSVPADWYMKLFEKFGLSPDWLKQGTGPMYLRTDRGYYPQEAPAHGVAEEPVHYGDPAAKGLITTVYSMAYDAVPEGQSPVLRAVGKISLPLSFVGNGLIVLRNQAPNMEPGIMRGAYLGVDTLSTHLVSGTLYALHSAHEGAIVRRIFLDSDNGCYHLRSDAPDYPESKLHADALSAAVLGRIAWVLQAL